MFSSFLMQGYRNMYTKAALILFLCPTVCCDLGFIQLYGYSVIGDTAAVYNTTNPQECADACYENSSNCIAFQMIRNTGQCYFYSIVRNIVYDADECSFYISNVAIATTVDGRTLTSPIDQQIQNLVYYNYDECPMNWDTNDASCTYNVAESKCNEYAPFLQAVWNASDSKCYMPLFYSTLTCPDSDYTNEQKTWDNPNAINCYYNFNQWTPSGSTDLYKQANDYCSAQIGGRAVDILSDDENTYIATYIGEGTTMIIGLISKTGTVSTVSDLRWNTGMPMDYLNFINGDEPNPTTSFEFTVMNKAGQWDTAATTTNFKGLICKCDVTNTLSSD